MKTTIEIDQQLLRQAQNTLGRTPLKARWRPASAPSFSAVSYRNWLMPFLNVSARWHEVNQCLVRYRTTADVQYY